MDKYLYSFSCILSQSIDNISPITLDSTNLEDNVLVLTDEYINFVVNGYAIGEQIPKTKYEIICIL